MIVVRIMYVAVLIGVVWMGQQQLDSCLGLCLSWSLEPSGSRQVEMQCLLKCSGPLTFVAQLFALQHMFEHLWFPCSTADLLGSSLHANVRQEDGRRECVFGSFRFCPSMWETLFFLGGRGGSGAVSRLTASLLFDKCVPVIFVAQVFPLIMDSTPDCNGA